MMKLPLLAILHSDNEMNIWVSILFLSTTTIFFFLRFRRQQSTNKSPPSPPKLPIIGNLHQVGSLRDLSKKYGPLMLLHFGSIPTLIVSSADMACQVMKAHDVAFASRPRSSMAKMLMYDRDMAFAPSGEYWRQVRKICVVHLLNTKMVRSSQPVREEEVSIMIDKIQSARQNSVDLSELLLVLSRNIISRVALGGKYFKGKGGAQKVGNTLSEFPVLMGSFPISDFVPWLGWLDRLSGLNARAKKNSEELEFFLEGVLEEHLQAKKDSSNKLKEDRDFVDVLLSLDGNDEGMGISLTKDNIKALILDMFIGATETSFTTLDWAMAELMKNPEIMKRVQEEVRGIVGCKQEIKVDDIEKMIYLKAIIKETLRLHSPAPLLLPRETIKEVKLEGFHIPVGTRVMVNAWAIGRDPSSWEMPEEFLPDRFLRSNIDFRGQDFQLIPFGAGRRICPGIDFALPTLELTLANLLHRFDWYLPEGLRVRSRVLIRGERKGKGGKVEKLSSQCLLQSFFRKEMERKGEKVYQTFSPKLSFQKWGDWGGKKV